MSRDSKRDTVSPSVTKSERVENARSAGERMESRKANLTFISGILGFAP